jgi:hypothetical protein
VIDNIISVDEKFGNQTIVAPVEWKDFGKWLGFHGGNISITITGFIEGSQRRWIKNTWELVRNVQSAAAHVPGTIPIAGIGVGGLILWGISWFFWFSSEMCFQTNMVIKTMEFEHKPRYKDKYVFSVTLEQLSFGLIQYIVDIAYNVVNGIWTIKDSPDRLGNNSISNRGGANTNILSLVQRLQMNSDAQVAIDHALSQPQVQMLSSSISSIQNTADIGQFSKEVTDINEMFPNIAGNYRITQRITPELGWFDIPFLDTFPQSFSFEVLVADRESGDIGTSYGSTTGKLGVPGSENQQIGYQENTFLIGHSGGWSGAEGKGGLWSKEQGFYGSLPDENGIGEEEKYGKLPSGEDAGVFKSGAFGMSGVSINGNLNFKSIVYGMEWNILDPVSDEDFPIQYLHLNLKRDGKLIFSGKIMERTQYTFNGEIVIYISNFRLSSLPDGVLTHNIRGMIAANG